MVVNLEEACAILSRLANVESDEIMSPSRMWPLPLCRSILYAHYNDIGLSQSRISRMFGKNHATIYSGLKRLNGWIEIRDPYVCDLYRRFKDECG